MDLRQLTPDLSVSPQIAPEDIAGLAKAGYKVVINNRPDEETEPGSDHVAMERLAREVGLEYLYIPFRPGQITPDMIKQFSDALALPGSKVAYCRSGNRSTVLWALSQAGEMTEQQIREVAAKAGYDLTPILGLLRSLAS